MFKALSQAHTINLAYLLNPQLSYVFKSFGVACGSKYIVKLGLEVPTLTQWPRGIHNKGRGTLVYSQYNSHKHTYMYRPKETHHVDSSW